MDLLLTETWFLFLAGAATGLALLFAVRTAVRFVRRELGPPAPDTVDRYKVKLETIQVQSRDVTQRNEQLKKEQEDLLGRRRALAETNEMLLMQKQELEQQALEMAHSHEELERMGDLTAWHQQELAERNDALERQTAEAERLSSELARRVNDLNHAMAQIDRMHRDQDSFLRHELRNAISPILGYAAMLQAERKFDPESASWLDGIRTSAESMERLLSELRDLQAIERGDRAIRRDPIELHDLVRASIQAVDPTDAAQIETQFEPVSVRGDRALLPGVFVNLIRNAVEHVQTVDRELRQVRVEIRADGADAVVRISNGGPPIPPKRLVHFFDRFNSTKEGGTGLGTSYADLVVRAHGGWAEVESDTRSGTVVTVRLPSRLDG